MLSNSFQEERVDDLQTAKENQALSHVSLLEGYFLGSTEPEIDDLTYLKYYQKQTITATEPKTVDPGLALKNQLPKKPPFCLHTKRCTHNQNR